MLYDPIRGKLVPATPEEKIRQALIRQMIGSLGYPKGLIAVEKNLNSLIPIPSDSDPNRRIDLLCFVPRDEGLKPLLLIECKVAQEESRAAESQAFGYNQRIGAPFIALAGPHGIKTLWREGGRIASVPFLPPFAQLVDRLCAL